jgi:hypothetical protein
VFSGFNSMPRSRRPRISSTPNILSGSTPLELKISPQKNTTFPIISRSM